MAAAKDEADLLRVVLPDTCQISAEVRRDAESACWYLECGDRPLQQLACDVTAMHQIAELSLAPDGQSLAVLSVGEGHPILEWVALSPLRDQGQYQVLCEQNPYPGTIWLNGWQDGQMKIGASVDLRIDGAESRIDVSDPRDFAFLWSANPCALTEQPPSSK
ncbi:hypothetical protein C7S18_04715 [Ahniella affigens]|uniref:Uncharacterized protein n=2 Tax=Ahniella affigens TaxID=2021234 RepID=A0A2P1PNX2_9GAMM|nr:hypothetical protein C7S18_04715 [Ahniella affigens]